MTLNQRLGYFKRSQIFSQHLHGVQGVGGSNPLAPTTIKINEVGRSDCRPSCVAFGRSAGKDLSIFSLPLHPLAPTIIKINEVWRSDCRPSCVAFGRSAGKDLSIISMPLHPLAPTTVKINKVGL